MAKQQKPNAASDELSVPAQIGRIAKLLALYLLRDIQDERDKILTLNGAGFSAIEIGSMLGKTENNVRVTLSKAKPGK